MTDALRARLSWLCDLVEREIRHLPATDSRVFHHPFTPDRVAALAADDAEAERVDAFVARVGRLQDTVGDKETLKNSLSLLKKGEVMEINA